MDEVLHPSRLAAWVRAIGVLAASPDLQAIWLDSLGAVASWNVGELGLEFDDGYLLLNQWVEAGWVEPAAVPSITALNKKPDEISGEGNAALWTREALDKHQAWQEVRTLAMVALTASA